MTRGEIWWADLGVPFGSEPGFRRPVLIVQADSFNRSSIGSVLCVPFTTNLRLGDAPGNVSLAAEVRDSPFAAPPPATCNRNGLGASSRRDSRPLSP